ncbi:MAG: twin-arginine translocation signal domain-containing protein, partial [Alphaproteobacteria bacterium]|nr:twin-arginine translocation signal domain-containing protein [Alphaproteobacteria bacterium]
MALNRRNVMKGAALSGAVLVVGGGGAVGWRASHAGLLTAGDAPFEPWAALADPKPGDPTGLAAAAILASSPHNTQPWRVSVSPDRLVIEADTERH